MHAPQGARYRGNGENPHPPWLELILVEAYGLHTARHLPELNTPAVST
jgi:hypothetical protein